jgi:hypothetical protein
MAGTSGELKTLSSPRPAIPIARPQIGGVFAFGLIISVVLIVFLCRRQVVAAFKHARFNRR